MKERLNIAGTSSRNKMRRAASLRKMTSGDDMPVPCQLKIMRSEDADRSRRLHDGDAAACQMEYFALMISRGNIDRYLSLPI